MQQHLGLEEHGRSLEGYFPKQDIAIFRGRVFDIKGRVTQDPRSVKLVAANPIATAWPGGSLDRATRGPCRVRIHKTTAPRLDHGSQSRSKAVRFPTYDILKAGIRHRASTPWLDFIDEYDVA